ncbi:MAG: hypothetical protein OM95_14705 [Bdellovibrio sp. ArHS]|uniref:complement resistance protein TraT n=1 Tax=Bdellovibrio sp. ArHS TaxID=1569284 RepID=UPI000582796B|nr:complement resistance protein TraT [Bdellovibrio sp. ArHS]KHD87430.1 MAG: hypothetical protein OM95_14705 [Bdellovibrio sp. ArHS]
MKPNLFKTTAFISILSLLSGCAATQVAVSKRNLDVQTKMSATLFIDPIEDEALKTVYLQVKNTSDKDFSLESELRNSLAAKGFKIASKMNQANFVIQVNVLQVGKMDPNAAEAAMYKGYGMDGAIIAAGTTSILGGSDKAVMGAGILGGLAAVVADSMVKDVHFSVITDLQIRERLLGKGKMEQTFLHNNQSGTSGASISKYSEKSDWKISQTRVLSSANKVNLAFEEAKPELQRSLAQSIAGIF